VHDDEIGDVAPRGGHGLAWRRSEDCAQMPGKAPLRTAKSFEGRAMGAARKRDDEPGAASLGCQNRAATRRDSRWIDQEDVQAAGVKSDQVSSQERF
jgi:hypothetical protein